MNPPRLRVDVVDTGLGGARRPTANCYELQQEEQACSGTFTAEARLDAGLLTHIMKFVPCQPALPHAP